VNDADAVQPLRRLRQVLGVAPGEDVHLVTSGNQVLGELPNIYVLPARVDATYQRQG
jgi:hypothetical protein